jgi:hypothetical protein
MISLELARALRAAGLAWRPQPGDAFVIPDRDLDDQVFVLSDMVVQTLDLPGGPPLLAFNGTTEWALDSLEAHEAVWLPHEGQLRSLLGDAFAALERVAGSAPELPQGYAVTVTTAAGEQRHVDITPEAAYARALLGLL